MLSTYLLILGGGVLPLIGPIGAVVTVLANVASSLTGN